MNEEVSILEVEKLGLPPDCAKEKKFHWLKISSDNSEVTPLKFVSMSSEVVSGKNINIRVFEHGEIRFDEQFAKFTFKDLGNITMNKPVDSIPENIYKLVCDYISSL